MYTYLISAEATGICIPVGNDEVLFAAVYNYPYRSWGDADIIEFLRFQRNPILAKHQFWNSSVSNPSGKELLELFQEN
jgi:hypothetical protein